MGITIKELAAKTGFGYGTVRRALSDRPALIKPGTREIILKAAKKYGYVKDISAEVLRRGKARDLGLVIPAVFGSAFYNDFYIKLISSVMEAVKRYSYNVRIFFIEQEKDLEMVTRDIKSLKISGVVYSSIYYVGFRVAAENLRALDVPVVVINEHIKGKNLYSVILDDLKGGYDGAEYLIKLGHRDIAVLRGRWKDIERRYEGFMQAMKDNNIKVRKEFDIRGDSTEDAGYEGVKAILEKKNMPSAIFALDDEMAIGAMRALEESGLKCPGDISILGFDGMDISRFSIPRLTTMVRPVDEMGQKAVEILLGGKTIKRKCEKVTAHIVERESCGNV